MFYNTFWSYFIRPPYIFSDNLFWAIVSTHLRLKKMLLGRECKYTNSKRVIWDVYNGNIYRCYHLRGWVSWCRLYFGGIINKNINIFQNKISCSR